MLAKTPFRGLRTGATANETNEMFSGEKMFSRSRIIQDFVVVVVFDNILLCPACPCVKFICFPTPFLLSFRWRDVCGREDRRGVRGQWVGGGQKMFFCLFVCFLGDKYFGY